MRSEAAAIDAASRSAIVVLTRAPRCNRSLIVAMESSTSASVGRAFTARQHSIEAELLLVSGVLDEWPASTEPSARTIRGRPHQQQQQHDKSKLAFGRPARKNQLNEASTRQAKCHTYRSRPSRYQVSRHPQRVLVTGGTGIRGSHIVRKLGEKQCAAVLAPPHSDYDLREHADATRMIRRHEAKPRHSSGCRRRRHRRQPRRSR